MRSTNLTNVDLNLLVTFNALMEERSVTGAARRMFLSQPAMSRAVDRLQAMFKDELLVRTTNGYEPTHRASVIYAELQQLLPRVEALFSESKFNPAEVTDLFRIESTDWGATVLVPGLIRVLAERAPGVQLDIVTRTDGFQRLETNEVDLVLTREIDLMSKSDAETKHLRSEFLLREKLVCFVRTGHPLARRRLTLREYLKAQHVSLSPMPMEDARRSPASILAQRQPVVAKALEQLGGKPNVRVRIPYFVPLGLIVESTDLVATVPLQIARRLRTPKLRIVPAPIEFQSVTYCQVWHSRNNLTPIHKWVRGAMRNLAEHLT